MPERGAIYLGARAVLVLVWAVGIGVFFLVASVVAAPSPVEVLIWTSPEKQNVLRPALDRYNAQNHTVTADRQRYLIHVRSVTINSGEMHDYLVRKLTQGVDFPASSGGAPTVLTPSTSDWLAQVNLELGQPVFDLAAARSVVHTPLVIFTYREMAECLGWPQQPIGWSDLIALAERPEGWAVCPTAKAEWGRKPLIAFTDPTVSSTAHTTLQLLHVIASGKPAEQFTPQDVDNPQVRAFVRRFQATVDHYYPDTIKLQTKMFLGPRFVHFAPVEEYILPWLYQGRVSAESASGAPIDARPFGELGYDVVAIYPKEGTAWHDNPYAVPEAPWVTPAQRAAAQAVGDYLLTDEVQREFVDWGFRPGTNLDLLPSQGIDPHQPTRLFGSLPAASAQAIQRAWEDVKKPGVVVLAIDTSTSMNGARLEQVRQGVRRFLDTASPATHIGLVTFASSVQAPVPVGPLVATRFPITDAMEALRGSGTTDLYDAVQLAVEMADDYEGVPGEAIRGVVVVTDGAASNGRGLSQLLTVHDRTEHEVHIELQNGPALRDYLGAGLVNPTRHPVHLFNLGLGEDADWEALRLFSESTGGVVVRAESADQGLAQLLERFSKYF